MGFREEEITDVLFESDVTRILFLGDSFTFGKGVVDGNDLFSEIIERKLNERDTALTQRFHVYNAGFPGTEPKRWLRYSKRLLPAYKPHHVFAIFFLRDGTSLCTSLRCYKEIIAGIKKKYQNNVIYQYTNIGRYIGDWLIRRDYSEYYLQQILDAYKGSMDETKVWGDQQEYLLIMKRLYESAGIDFHLVIFPLLYGLESNYQFYSVEDEITGFARTAGIPVFSLTPGFIGLNSKSLWVGVDDQHPNEKGHRVAAKTLYPYMEKVVSQ